MYCSYDFEQIQKNSSKEDEDSIQGVLSGNLDVLHDLIDYKERHTQIPYDYESLKDLNEEELQDLASKGLISKCSVDNCPIFTRRPPKP